MSFFIPDNFCIFPSRHSFQFFFFCVFGTTIAWCFRCQWNFLRAVAIWQLSKLIPLNNFNFLYFPWWSHLNVLCKIGLLLLILCVFPDNFSAAIEYPLYEHFIVYFCFLINVALSNFAVAILIVKFIISKQMI